MALVPDENYPKDYVEAMAWGEKMKQQRDALAANIQEILEIVEDDVHGVGVDMDRLRAVVDSDSTTYLDCLKTEWPPVGCMVEHPTGRGTVMLLPDVNGVTIIQSIESGSDGEYKRVAASACRPIRSEEDRVVDEMVRALSDAGCEGFAMKHYARALYRAGYRRLGEGGK